MSTDSDDRLRQILSSTRVIALVGYSANPERASHKVAHYLADHGYRVVPVNPGLAGQDFRGETIAASLEAIPADVPVDMLDVFRAPEHVVPIVESAIEHLPHLRTVWLQIGVTSEQARQISAEHGLAHVEDRCPKIEHARLMG